MNSRAQVSIEFVIIIVIALIYINTVTNPLLVQTSTLAAEDVQRASDVKISAQKLANAINEAAASPGESRKTIRLYLPLNSSISCNNESKEINYFVGISNLYCRQPAVSCVYSNTGKAPFDDTCSDASAGSYQCSSSIRLLASAILGNCPKMEGPLYADFTIVKDATGEIDVQQQG